VTTPDLTDWNARFNYARQVQYNGPMEPTADHCTLLAHARWDWNDCEFGAASQDPKFPYGNSDADRDLAELLPHLSENDRLRIHCELPVVLAFITRNWAAATSTRDQELT
jgi:hypothetical protein